MESETRRRFGIRIPTAPRAKRSQNDQGQAHKHREGYIQQIGKTRKSWYVFSSLIFLIQRFILIADYILTFSGDKWLLQNLLEEDYSDLANNEGDFDCLTFKYGFLLEKAGYKGNQAQEFDFNITGVFVTNSNKHQKDRVCVRCGFARSGGTRSNSVQTHHGTGNVFCKDGVYSTRSDVPFPQMRGLFVEDSLNYSVLTSLCSQYDLLDDNAKRTLQWSYFNKFVTSFFIDVKTRQLKPGKDLTPMKAKLPSSHR